MKNVLVLAALLALVASRPAVAQMFKCTDGRGKVTYSNTKCSELKLKDAGEVQDRVQVTPAFRPPPPSTPSFQPPSAQQPQEPRPAAAADQSQEKERRCFTVAAAGGKKVTRCNDKPDEPAE